MKRFSAVVLIGKINRLLKDKRAAMQKRRSRLVQLPKPVKAPTTAQLKQRTRFGLASSFLKPINHIVAIGYQKVIESTTGVNAAMRSILITAITGEFPDLVLDYPAIQISTGDLDGAYRVSVISAAGGQVIISWEVVDYLSLGSSMTDLTTIVFYSPLKRKFVTVHRGPLRSKLTHVFQLPSTYAGDNLYGWMYFSSPDGKEVSATDYLGQVVVMD